MQPSRIVCSLALFIRANIAWADVVSTQPPLTNPAIGGTFTVDINVNGITDLYAFQFDLTFNPTLLSAVSVTEGGFLPSGGTTSFIPGTIDNVGGTVAATADSLIGAIPGVTGNGTLVEFRFTALSAGTTAMSFANEILLDSSLNDITANTTFQNGSVTINGVAAVPEPTSFALLDTGLIALMTIGGLYRRRSTNR